jgi:hypothetical protein
MNSAQLKAKCINESITDTIRQLNEATCKARRKALWLRLECLKQELSDVGST